MTREKPTVDQPYSSPNEANLSPKRVTAHTLKAMKGERRIAAVTAYDATFAAMLDDAGADVLLVGDSLGMVVQGLDSTLPVTVDEIVYHSRAVARGARRAHVVADMPFMSYQSSPRDGVRNAGRILKHGGAHAVKIEGGVEIAETVTRLIDAGIPVMGHVGLKPQSIHAMGGYRVQGVDRQSRERVRADAKAVAKAGAYAIVLEGIPSDVAEAITREVDVPTIGIGAGPACDGQVLVCYDLLGLNPKFHAKFVKKYDDFYDRGKSAVSRFCEEVRSGQFPGDEHTFTSKPSVSARPSPPSSSKVASRDS